MKTLTLMISAVVLMLAASCGPSAAERTAALEGAAAGIDSLVTTSQAPFDTCRAVYAEPNVLIEVALRDSMIKVDLLGDALMDYFAADWLKASDQTRVYDVLKTLRRMETPVVLSIRDTYGASKSFIFNADKISRLLKAKPSSLDVPKVKEQVVAMASASAPAPWAHQGCQVSAAINKGFLTYTIVWPSKAALNGMEQGNITGRYLDPLRRQYARLGDLEYPVVEMLKGLGIDGVRIEYTADGDSDRAIKQAFPWREIFK